MRVCVAQSKSKKGQIDLNIKHHIKLVKKAIALNADLIIFPELSITGYEPELANKLACNINDERFKAFQDLANDNNVIIGVGMPTLADKGINISIIIFQAFKERTSYAKHLLHKDEMPFFTAGKKPPFIINSEKNIALGICYETLKRAHIVSAIELKANIYITSVAKPEGGLKKAYSHYPSIAREFNTPILMANSVGFCDNFMSEGNSAVWSSNGELMAQLNEKVEGLLVYDTEKEDVQVFELEE